jgi:hypothetical protein
MNEYARIYLDIFISSVIVLFAIRNVAHTPVLSIISAFLIVVFAIIIDLCIPISHALIFACGYTIIRVLGYNKEKVKARPFYAIYIIIKVFIEGFFNDLTSVGDIIESRCGDYIYTPLFKIEKI